MALDPKLLRIAPITAFCISLSSCMVIATLQQFDDDNADGSTGSNRLPDQLFRLAETHFDALCLLIECVRRFDMPFQIDLKAILSSSIRSIADGSQPPEVDCTALKLHRWIDGGLGVRALSTEESDERWLQLGLRSWIWKGNVQQRSESVWSAICDLCNPSRRIFQPNIFSLDISGPGTLFGPILETKLTGAENQSLRFSKCASWVQAEWRMSF